MQHHLPGGAQIFIHDVELALRPTTANQQPTTNN
jgi:hypothetical protein